MIVFRKSSDALLLSEYGRLLRFFSGFGFIHHAALDIALDVVDVPGLGACFVGFDEEGVVVPWEADFIMR